MVLIFMCILVLKELATACAGLECSRVYSVYEVVQLVRCLCLRVSDTDHLPGPYEIEEWKEFTVDSLVLDRSARCLLSSEFSQYRTLCESDEEFEELLNKVENVFVSVAMGLLNLPGVKNSANVCLSAFCPVLMAKADDFWLYDEVDHFCDLLLAHGRVTFEERRAMFKSYRDMVERYRAEQCGDVFVAPDRAVGMLFDLVEGDDAGISLLCAVFSLCGLNREKGVVLVGSIPERELDFVNGVCRTVRSWCMAKNVRNFDSIPDGLVDIVSQCISQVGDLYDELEDGMWERVGRVASLQFRKDVMARLGFTVAGQPISSPVVARRSTRD